MEDKQMMQLILDKLDGMQNQMNGMQNQMNGMQTQINDMQTQMNGMQTQMNGMQTQMNGMQAQISDMNVTLDHLDKRVEHLEAGQLSIRRDISKLDKKIDILTIESGQALDMLANAVDHELSRLKEAK